jgi:hypothetical protein
MEVDVLNTSTYLTQITAGQKITIRLVGEFNVYLNGPKVNHMNVVTDAFPWGPTIRIIFLDPDHNNKEINDFDFNSKRNSENEVTYTLPAYVTKTDVYIKVCLTDKDTYTNRGGRSYYVDHAHEQLQNFIGRISGNNPKNPFSAYFHVQ